MNTTSSPRPVQLIFLFLPLVVGEGLAGASVVLFGPPGGAEYNLLPPALFGVVWLCLYPTFGIASLRVFESAPGPARTAAVRRGWIFLLLSWTWMPVACAAGSPWVTVGLDLIASSILAATALAYSRATSTGGKWLLPTALWMPITTALSLHAAISA